MNTITKVKCKCQHEWQDSLHGHGVRVANRTQKEPDKDHVEVRCTVCKALHRVHKGQLR